MKKKLDFSKKLFIGVSALIFSITVFSCVMIWRTGDLSPLSYLITAAFTELATATGFYYNKARHENEIKLRKKYGNEIYKDSREDIYR